MPYAYGDQSLFKAAFGGQVFHFEEDFSNAIVPHGLLVAIGDRKDSYGAGKIIVNDEKWKDHFHWLATHSCMIFVQPDLTPSVRWELGELVAEMSYLRKTVLVMPHSGGDEWTEIRDGLRQDIGVVLPPHHAGGGMFRLRPGPDDVLVAPNTFILSLTRALEEADCNGKQFDAEEVWEELVADERDIRTNDKKLREIRRDIPLLGRWSLSDGSGAAKSWPEVHSVPAATAVLPAAANDCEAKPKRAKVISKSPSEKIGLKTRRLQQVALA